MLYIIIHSKNHKNASFILTFSFKNSPAPGPDQCPCLCLPCSTPIPLHHHSPRREGPDIGMAAQHRVDFIGAFAWLHRSFTPRRAFLLPVPDLRNFIPDCGNFASSRVAAVVVSPDASCALFWLARSRSPWRLVVVEEIGSKPLSQPF